MARNVIERICEVIKSALKILESHCSYNLGIPAQVGLALCPLYNVLRILEDQDLDYWILMPINTNVQHNILPRECYGKPSSDGDLAEDYPSSSLEEQEKKRWLD